MQFLRLVAGPLAAVLLILAPASMPAFAQAAPDAPVQAPATQDDLAYQATFSAATTDVTALLALREGIDARIVAADANTDYALLVSDLMTINSKWQAVSERIIVLQPTPRYVTGNLNMAIATQTFAEGYKALATSFGTNDPALLLGAMQAITAAGGMLNAAGMELQAA
jgi:hypothetical protein